MSPTEIRRELLGLMTRLQKLSDKIGAIEDPETEGEADSGSSYRDQIAAILKAAGKPMRGVEVDRVIRKRYPGRYISTSTVPSTLVQECKKPYGDIKLVARGIYRYETPGVKPIPSEEEAPTPRSNKPLVKCNQCEDYVAVSMLGQHKTYKHPVTP